MYWKSINFRIQILGEITIQILKLYWKSWPKFKQVSKKIPNPRTLELLMVSIDNPLLILLLSFRG
jgi:hypothetical protein